MVNKTDPESVEWVPIIDPGVAVPSECGQKGVREKIFIQSTKKNNGHWNNPLVGWVWPGEVFYPDFNHPNSTRVWHSCFEDFMNKYNFLPSGIWIDMNENSNFNAGE